MAWQTDVAVGVGVVAVEVEVAAAVAKADGQSEELWKLGGAEREESGTRNPRGIGVCLRERGGVLKEGRKEGEGGVE